MKKLNPKILTILSKKTGKAEITIRKDISLLKRKHPSCTSNAVAQIYASHFNFSVMQKLDAEDKKTLPHIDVEKSTIKIKQKSIKKRETINNLIIYDTKEYFINEHIKEINRAFSKGCYTCTNLLARKIIENLLIDILKKKYPPTTKINKELYYDIDKRRMKDFSVILENLYKKRNDFDLDNKKIIERINSLVKRIKDDANDKTHSWFYIVKSKNEIIDLDFQTIIELIKKLELSVGIRS